jgi:hypothetical protein
MHMHECVLDTTQHAPGPRFSEPVVPAGPPGLVRGRDLSSRIDLGALTKLTIPRMSRFH